MSEDVYTFPISLAQRRLWFLDQLVPGNPAYNVTLPLRIQGSPDLLAVERALNEVIARHEALRTIFKLQDDEAVQVVSPPWPCDLPIVDLSHMSAAERESTAQRLVDKERSKPFDLQQGPLLRVSIIRLAFEECVMVFSMHHIISDGWSMQVLVRELCTLYEDFAHGRPSSLRPLPIQLADFTLWQHELMGTGALAGHLSYWTSQLTGLEPLDLPTDHPRPPVQSSKGARVEFTVSSEVSNKLRQLCQRENVTPFMALLAAYLILLHRYTQQSDISVGSPFANRSHAELDGLIGFFASTLVLRGDLSGDPTVSELLQRIRKTTLEAYEHQDVSFEKLVEVLRPDRDLSRNPLFQTSFSLENDFSREVQLSDLRVSPFLTARMTTRVDLEACLVDAQEAFSGWLIYSADLFEPRTIARMADHFIALVSSITGAPERHISQLCMLGEAERTQIVKQSRGPRVEYPSEQCIHELFEEQVSKRADAPAAWFEGQELTYSELNRRANQLAHFLRTIGVAPDVPVGICLERSLDMLVSILGVLKAGGCYVPLDPTYPADRLAFLVNDASVPVMVTSSHLQRTLPPSDAYKVCVDTQRSLIASQSGDNPDSGVGARNLAYIIYTSGSTGKPKGTLIEHRGLRNVAEAQANLFGLASEDRVLQFASLSFDASIFEIVMAIRAAGTLCIAPSLSLLPGPGLAKVLREAAVTIVTLPPSALSVMEDEDFPALRLITVAGESCAQELVDRWAPGRRFFNLYGPTETTIWATAAECFAGNPHPSIGTPVANTSVYLLDEHRQMVPAGVRGEIYLGGAGVARGYLNRSKMTAERFVHDSFGGEPEGRLYRTGDQACWRADGMIRFLGRVDRQIKIRGFRIEPGEIEDELRKHPLVREAVVTAREGVSGEQKLTAFVVPSQHSEPSTSELRKFLREHVPEHMVPSLFVPLESIPLTPSGKVDWKALPIPRCESDETKDLVAEPSTDLERKIATIWKELLGAQRIGRCENFFDLGGHSLLIAKLHQRLRATIGKDLSIVDLFKYPTVASLAAFLNGPEKTRSTQVGSIHLNRRQREPIAIVAMAGRFAGASTIEEFWENLRQGVESIRPYSPDELIKAGVDPEAVKDSRYVRAGSVLENVAEFDAKFFGVSPREAEIMDPQHRIFLECSHEALERAGCDPKTYRGRIGVFAGARMSSYLINNLYNNPVIEDASAIVVSTGNNTDSLPARVAYKLDLRGPAVNVQTTCSTSLVAVHLAYESLQHGDCDLAIAGGAGIQLPQGQGYLYEEEGILSPDGHCRAFDAKARGTVLGNGVALVVLKRLSDAQADGDNILAVIKGSAINNDGAQKVGFAAPSVTGQAEVIAAAQAAADVDPETVTYVETHGTGTLLGDPIEIAALAQAYHSRGAAKWRCALGSVKANIGHLDAAAGVAGLIKTVLQLQHKELVPSLHFEEPNAKIDFANGRFYVNTHLCEWQVAPGVARRAGVSSFGIGGTNAHVVLEEAPERTPSNEARNWQLLTVSAKTSSALEQAKKNLAQYLRKCADADLADVAYTQLLGRTAYPYRWAMLCRTRAEAITGLEGGEQRRVFVRQQEQSGRPVVFMFPGQGTQYVHMGRELYESEPCFRKEVDECSKELLPYLGLDLRSILYPLAGQEGASEQLRETWITQPSLFVVEYALAQLLASWGVRPQLMIGHSLGEYVAATISGVFTRADALRLVALRGRLMQSTERGAMLAVPVEESELTPTLPSQLSLAAVNAPGMCVISGPVPAIAEFECELKTKNIEARRLATSHAFHSAMMDPILEEFRAAASRINFGSPVIPFISNVTGKWISKELATDPDYWVKHLRQAVRFGDGAAYLLTDENRVFIEVGPGNTLAGLLRKHPVDHAAASILGSLPHCNEKQGEIDFLGRSYAQLWLAGASMEVEALYAGQRRRRLALPTYPFERQKYWVEPPTKVAPSNSKPSKKPDVADWFYIPSWERTTPILWSESQPTSISRWLLFADEEGIAQAVAARISRQGHEVVIVSASDFFAELDDHSFSVRPDAREQFETLLRSLRDRGWIPERILHFWLASPSTSGSDCLSLGFHSLLCLAQALEAELGGTAVEISVATVGLHRVLGHESICADKATALGPCTVIPQEYPHLRCRTIDVDQNESTDVIAENFVAEVTGNHLEPLVAHRAGYRWVRGFKAVRLLAHDATPLRFRPGGVYLITGGLRGMGLEIAKYLGETLHARLVLLGRTAMPARTEWDRLASGDDTELAHTLRELIDLERCGVEILHLVADVSKPDDVSIAIQSARKRFGQINGVIHAAGIPGGTMISRETPQTAESVLAAKLYGTKHLYQSLHDSELDFFVSCSSQRSVIGGPGQAAYCAANAFLDSFAEANFGPRHPLTISVVWDTWGEVGMAARQRKSHDDGETAEFKNNSLVNRDGVAIFERIISNPLSVVVVSMEDFPSRVEHFRRISVSTMIAEVEKRRDLNAGSGHARPHLRAAYVPPRDSVESTLATIWQKVLAIDVIGVADNFFELGGDSVVSLQVASQARAAGLQLTPKQVFQHQTIAELAAVVGRGRPTVAEQGLVTGPTPLTPIQSWFFSQQFANFHHYNQATMIELRRRIADPDLRRVIALLLNHHDALRMRYKQSDCTWQQYCAGEDVDLPFTVQDLSGVADSDLSTAITKVAEHSQASLHLTQGPLIRLVLFDCGLELAQRLLVVIHHLVIDVVSWRLLLEDLETALGQLAEGQAIRLPAKTTSFLRWAEHLAEQALSGAFDSELEYWLSEGAKVIEPLPTDMRIEQVEQTQASAAMITRSLTVEETRTLLHNLPSRYATKIDHALLAVLAETIGSWTGKRRARIEIEGLGRDIQVENIDLSRTVGWFTALYPVVIETEGSTSFWESLRAVKEQLNRIPNHGIGYGVLRYLRGQSNQLSDLPQAEICFLFLGQKPGARNGDGWFVEARESSGQPHASEAQMSHRLSIITAVVEGALRVTWMYSGKAYRRSTLEGVADSYISCLRDLISDCRQTRQSAWRSESAKLFHWTPAQLQRIASAIEGSSDPMSGDQIESVSPLSPMQAGMLFHTLLAPEAGEYSKRACCILKGELNVEAFQLAWQQVADRHEVLRTAIVWHGVDFPVQVVHRDVKLLWDLRDWTSLTASLQDAEQNCFLQEEGARGFQLSSAPLMRFALLRTAKDRFTFVWSFHHILADGWSIPRILQEVFARYDAIAKRIPFTADPAPSYQQFVAWLCQQDGTAAEEFWRQYLRGFGAPTPLVVDNPSTRNNLHCYKEIRVELGVDATARLLSLAQGQHLTPNTLVQGAWAILLSRYSGQRDVLFGATVAGRPASLPGVESTVGLFINTIPVRVKLNPDAPLGAWLNSLQSQHSEARQYEWTSLIDIHKWSGLPATQRLFESLVIFENYPTSDIHQQVAGLELDLIQPSERTSFPIAVIASLTQRMLLTFSYDATRFDDDVIERIIGHYRTLLENMPNSVTLPLRALPLLMADETNKITAQWNDTATNWETTDLVPQLIERQAARTPDLTALRYRDDKVSYAEFEKRTNQLARYLSNRGAARGTLVGVCMERSIEMALALAAVIKTGAAYVPLDPEYPSERLRFMIRDAAAPLLLTQKDLLDRLPDNNADIITLDDQWERVFCESSDSLATQIAADDLVYVIYTSGSTGQPKGAMNTHAGLVNRLLWMQREYRLNSEDRVMQKTPFSFDVSVWEFFWPLLTGACLVIAEPGSHRDPSYLVELISKEKITTLHFVPSMLRAFLQESDLRPCRSLKKVICSGEALTSDLQDQFFSRLDCELHNLYGPTEASIDVTYWRCARGEAVGPSVPIGRPIANTQIYILDRDLNHVPVGVPGELHIGGVGVARGYWHRPELTGEKFIPDPFNAQSGARLYKSGDLARFRPDGVIEYVGRMDHQIKIRGQRVELGEIEAALRDYPGVCENVVTMREGSSGDKHLIAYLVVADQPDPSISELRSFLKQRIPEHMVPSAFVFLESLPLSPNGKLDRSALPDPQKTRAELDNQYVEPSSPDEIVLARIWAGVLEVDKIGLQDNFFELGGHSLLALQMLSRIREVFEIEFPLRSFFNAPTISQLREVILEAEQTPGRVEKIAKLFLAVSDMSDDEVSSVLQQKSAAAE